MRAALNAAMGIALTAVGFAAQSSQQAEPPNMSTLRRMITTVNAGDATGYARLYSTDAVITIYGGESIKGRAAIERYEVSLMRQFPGTRLAFYSVWQAPPHTVVHYGVNGRTTAGQPMGHEGLLFFRFDDAGAIVEERRYLDSLTPMAQLGALGSGPARSLPALPADLVFHTMSHSRQRDANVALVRDALRAIESRNADAFSARIGTAISIDELMLPEPLHGRSEAERWFMMWGAVGGLRIEVTRMLGVGDDVLAETITGGTLSAPFGRLSATAKPFAVHRAFVVRITNDRIARIVSFINGKELAESTGQWPLR